MTFSPTSATHLQHAGHRAGSPAGRASFSPDHLRQVMGPGYQVALFREGRTLTGIETVARSPRPVRAGRPPVSRRPRPPLAGFRLSAGLRSLRLMISRPNPKPLATQAI